MAVKILIDSSTTPDRIGLAQSGMIVGFYHCRADKFLEYDEDKSFALSAFCPNCGREVRPRTATSNSMDLDHVILWGKSHSGEEQMRVMWADWIEAWTGLPADDVVAVSIV